MTQPICGKPEFHHAPIHHLWMPGADKPDDLDLARWLDDGGPDCRDPNDD